MNKKAAVLFPGIGYTCEKPLLYYAGKIAAGLGYEIISVPYGNFEKNIRGDKEKMEQTFYNALGQAEELLKDIPWEAYDDILFISKSVGTIVSSAYAKKRGISVRNILLTPLEQTFLFAKGDCIAFHGTADPWAGTESIAAACGKSDIPLYLTEGANHSLETGDVQTDLENMKQIMAQIAAFIRQA